MLFLENGCSSSVAPELVLAFGQLSEVSLCLLPWSDSGQPFLCGPQSSFTDLRTCCSGAQGAHRGDWYFPDGTRLPLPFHSDGIYVTRYLQRRNSLVEVVICSSLVDLRELLYIIETMLTHHLVFIVAVLVQTRFMVITITQRGNQSL